MAELMECEIIHIRRRSEKLSSRGFAGVAGYASGAGFEPVFTGGKPCKTEKKINPSTDLRPAIGKLIRNIQAVTPAGRNSHIELGPPSHSPKFTKFSMKSAQEESMSRDRRLLYGITNWALFAAGMANLGAGTWAAFTAAPTLAATSLTAGLVLLFAATIERFESFKGLGIEAKTRQLDQKISQADDALKRLREMTELTGSALIDINCKIGRWDSAPEPRDFIALADRIRDVMKSVGSDEDSILITLGPWARTLCFDMAHAKTIELRNIMAAKVQALEKERQAIKHMQTNDPQHLRISEELRTLQEFQQSRLRKFHKLNLEDFPDKFMSVFSDVPMIEEDVLRPLRAEAAKFAPGMESLVKSRKIVDRELWIEALNARRDS